MEDKQWIFCSSGSVIAEKGTGGGSAIHNEHYSQFLPQ
jgi:hypothetical protein